MRTTRLDDIDEHDAYDDEPDPRPPALLSFRVVAELGFWAGVLSIGIGIMYATMWMDGRVGR